MAIMSTKMHVGGGGGGGGGGDDDVCLRFA